MLSFNPVNEKSLPIAFIHNKKKNNIVYLSNEQNEPIINNLKNLNDDNYDDDDNDDYDDEYDDDDNDDDHDDNHKKKPQIQNNKKIIKSITLDDVNHRFSLLPNSIEGIDRLYIVGPSDSGKSSIIRSYTQNFIKMFKDKKIYLFSDLTEDEKLDDIKRIKRIELNEDFLDNPIHPEEIANSLVIFDDIDSAPEKILKEVEHLRDACLKRGRHSGLHHIVISNHLLTNYASTRCSLSEATHIIVFANSGSINSLRYLLKNYVGLSNKQIDKVKKIKSRWCCFRVRAPQCLITENQIFLLSELE